MILIPIGCSPPQTGGNGGPNDDVNTDHITPPPLPDDSAKAFAVMVTPDRRSGGPGTRFVLTAEAIGNDADIQSFAWSIDGDAPSADTAEVALTIDDPGEHAIQVTLRDASGAEVTEGVILRVFDPADAPQPRTAEINPSAGFPGTFVRIESAALNDSAALAEVSVNGGEPFEPYRPELGVANFLIPLDAAEGLGATGTVVIELRTDGDQAEQFDFELSPLPALDDSPGTLVRSWLTTAPEALESAESDLNAAVRGIAADVTEEELALLRALLRLAVARFRQMDESITPLLDELDAETLTLIDQVLIANGATADVLDDLTILAKGAVLAKNSNDILIDRLCRFHDLVRVLIAFTDAVQNTAVILEAEGFLSILLAIGAANPVAIKVGLQVVSLASSLLNAGIIGDVLKQLDALVPKVGDELIVTTTPGTLLNETEQTTVRVRAQLEGPTFEICGRSTDDIIHDLSERAAQRITQGAASAEQAWAMLGHTFGGAGPSASPSAALAQVRSYLADIINAITSSAITSFGLDDLLGRIREKLCSSTTGKELLLQPDPEVLTQDPDGSGIFSGLEEESVRFACNRDMSRTVTFRAERTCGSRMLSGEGRVTCGGEMCTEDALEAVTTTMTITSFPRNNPCQFLSEQLRNDVVEVFITNNHPSRTIAVAAVTIFESDKQQLPRGPCEDPGNFSSPEECSERITDGCNTPPGLFIEPGQTSTFGVLFNCAQEGLYPPNGGTCGELEIETVRGHVIIQAVYCDDLDKAQDNFCNLVHSRMTLTGEPEPTLRNMEVRPCP